MKLQQADNTLKFQTNMGGAIESFLKEKYVQSPNTAIAYKGDISSFLEAVYDCTIETVTKEQLESLDYKTLSEYRNTMYGTLSDSSVNRNISTIKSLIKHLKATGEIDSDITYLNLVKSVKIKDEKQYPHASKEVVEQFMNATRFEQFKSDEKRLLIMLGADTGLRLQELLALKVSDFKKQEDGTYIIRGKGKGAKEYVDVVGENIYREILKVAKHNDKIFTLSSKNVWQMMTRLNKLLGYEHINYVFHSFKKSAVTFTYKRTGSISHAMKKGRHSKPETVMRYLEDDTTGLTGMFSAEAEVEDDLYKNVSHEKLLKALNKLDKTSLLLLNIELGKMD